MDVRIVAIQNWIATQQRIALENQAAELRNERAAEIQRLKKIWLDLVTPYLGCGELSYDEREELLELLEGAREYGISLPTDVQAAADEICATKDMKAAVRRLRLR